MIDFPIDELFDEEASTIWLERNLHPEGLGCPRCQSKERRIARRGTFTGYRCKSCDRYYTVLTATIFEKTRQKPSKLVLILRGIAKGESTARLARELVISRKHMHKLRHRVQQNLLGRLPTGVREDEVQFEADELYQNAGEKKRPAYGGTRPAQEASKQGERQRHI
jgi:transposase-like protein